MKGKSVYPRGNQLLMKPFHPDGILFPTGEMNITAMKSMILLFRCWDRIRQLETRGRPRKEMK